MTLFSLISNEECHLVPGQKVISKDEIETLVTADELLEKVRVEIAEHREEVNKECADLKKEAEEKGFQEGLMRLNEHILHFDQQVKDMRLEMQKMVLPLALKAAQKIVGKELELTPGVIVDIVMQAIAPVSEQKKICILVNKEDLDAVIEAKDLIKQKLDQVEQFKIEESHEIEKGGCKIETETGIINATLENQWRALEAAFEKYST